MTSPLQLLSTAASCTPKLKVNTSQSFQQLPLTLPTTTTMINQQQHLQTKPNVQNRAIKIIPANTKLIKPQQQQTSSDLINKTFMQQQQSTIIAATPSKFKIQKIQLVNSLFSLEKKN